VVLGITVLFSFLLVVNGIAGWLPMSMPRSDIVRAIESSGVVAVVRLRDAAAFAEVAAALVEGGVRAIEITMTCPAR